jgi:hypothetical protein
MSLRRPEHCAGPPLACGMPLCHYVCTGGAESARCKRQDDMGQHTAGWGVGLLWVADVKEQSCGATAAHAFSESGVLVRW